MESQTSTPQSPSTYSESSKTVSSSRSGEEDDEEKGELNLNKDNASSPVDLECHIQAERITKILDEAVYKTKLALCIPYLVNGYRPLREIMKFQHFDDLIFIFEQYENPLFSASLLNMAAMEDIKAGDLSLKNRLNPELGHLMYIINSYATLKPVVEMKIPEIKCEYQPQQLTNKSEHQALEYLLLLERFRDLMVEQMNTTAAEELTAKMNTRKLEASNKKLLDLIKDSDRQMVLASRAHAVKSEMLKEEEQETTESYNSLLRSHLIEEKSQRARRFKVETQLQSWLQKYDAEIGDKQKQLEELTAKHDDECKKCEELETKLEAQDLEFFPLMAERDEEYHQEMAEKMSKFLLEHSARVIQSAWRQVVVNRAEKTKLRKLVKKMQAAQAAQAAAQAALEKKSKKSKK